MTTSTNIELATANFALEYSHSRNIERATVAGMDMLDNNQQEDDYAQIIASFICGQLELSVEKYNEDGSWRTEKVSYNA